MNRLEQLRIDAGLSPRALAAEVDVSHQTVINIEQGSSKAHASSLKKLADYFEVPASTLTRPAVFSTPEDAAA